MAENNFKNETEFVFSSEFIGFTTIPNYILNDRSISFKALGIYCAILQFQNSPTHKISIKGLMAIHSDGERSVTSGLDELLNAGFLVREQLRDNGKIKGYKYTVHMKPVKVQTVDETDSTPKRRFADTEKSDTGNVVNKKKISKKENINNENKKTTTAASSGSSLNSNPPTVDEVEIYSAFKNSLGKAPNDSVKLQIRGISAHQDTELIITAIQMAAQNNKEWNYAKGILTKWKVKGILTISQYLAEEDL